MKWSSNSLSMNAYSKPHGMKLICIWHTLSSLVGCTNLYTRLSMKLGSQVSVFTFRFGCRFRNLDTHDIYQILVYTFLLLLMWCRPNFSDPRCSLMLTKQCRLSSWLWKPLEIGTHNRHAPVIHTQHVNIWLIKWALDTWVMHSHWLANQMISQVPSR